MPFNPCKPFNPKSISYKYMTFTAHAKRKNRLMLQQKFDIEEECPICLESMNDKPVIYTPCKHRFHAKCMFTLLGGEHLSKYKCSLCRFDLTSAIMKLYGDDMRLGLLMIFLVGAPRNEVVANEVAANEVAANEVAANEVLANEPISLFDEESEEEYEEDEDSNYDSEEDNEDEDER
jgi:hypothetical protein